MTFTDILTFKHGWNFFMAVYGNEVIHNVIYTSIFALFSLPYVILAIKNKTQIWKILLLIPYTVAVSYTHLDVYKRQDISLFTNHHERENELYCIR